jgi:hypothetical protein
MIGNKLNYCPECRQFGNWSKVPLKDGEITFEFRFLCKCGHTTVNPNKNYLEGIN